MRAVHLQSAGIVAIFLALMLSVAAMPASAQQPVGTGAFPKAHLIDKQLKRGVSTKTDVQRVLGIPNGSGGALLPGYGDKSTVLDTYQVWYYEDIETTDYKSGKEGMNIKLRQQILLVFFKGNIFHGYFWTTNSDVAEMR